MPENAMNARNDECQECQVTKGECQARNIRIPRLPRFVARHLGTLIIWHLAPGIPGIHGIPGIYGIYGIYGIHGI